MATQPASLVQRRCLNGGKRTAGPARESQKEAEPWWRGSASLSVFFSPSTLYLNSFSDESELGLGQMFLVENSEAGQGDPESNAQAGCATNRGPYHHELCFRGAGMKGSTA